MEKVLEIGTEVLSEWDLKVDTAITEWTQLILAEDPNQCGQEEWKSAKSLGSHWVTYKTFLKGNSWLL